jgi:two-component system NtrC family sensor kinase
MRIRTKVWLLVAVSVVLTAGVTMGVRIFVMRRALLEQSQGLGRAVANELVSALEHLGPDVEDRDLALTVQTYLYRFPQIQRLQLLVDRETSASPSFRIVAPRGEQLQINRTPTLPNYRQREHVYTSKNFGEGIPAMIFELPVELQGPWKAMLSMRWDLGSMQTILQLTERSSLLLGGANLVVLLLLMGFITDRVILRRLEGLARAMRDVEGGDLERRVPVDGTDEVGKLGEGFNRMLDQLSSADREIRAFSQRLADEIQAATRDLSKKNLALAQLNRLLNDLRQENASRVRLATLGQLAAQLAHEIGTPLSSVSGHLQLARLQRDLPSGLRERLDVASREIERIGRIVRDYLDSTRSLEPEQKPTSLAQVLAEAVEVTVSIDPGGRRSIDLDCRDDPADFVTDPGLLRQILINLLSNAFDAVERGGKVSLAARVENGEDVVITVSDTGAGISPEDLRRIFEPFYTTKGRGKGTGLGLAICRELVAALGGAIAVESTPGRGSTFIVRLPRHGQGKPEGTERRRVAREATA